MWGAEEVVNNSLPIEWSVCEKENVINQNISDDMISILPVINDVKFDLIFALNGLSLLAEEAQTKRAFSTSMRPF